LPHSVDDIKKYFVEWAECYMETMNLVSLLKLNKNEVAICSNHGTQFFDIYLQKFHLLDYFDSDLIVVSQQVEKAKPDISIFNIVDQRLQSKHGQQFSKERV